MSTATSFKRAAEDVMHLKNVPSSDEMLEVYALFKQATVGDCNTQCPSIWDVKGNSKWNAWNTKKGVSRTLAEESYISLVKRLKNNYGYREHL